LLPKEKERKQGYFDTIQTTSKIFEYVQVKPFSKNSAARTLRRKQQVISPTKLLISGTAISSYAKRLHFYA
jgi:hypothetical protein